MSEVPTKRPQNQILSALSSDDFALLSTSLENVDLPRRRSLEHRGRRVEHIYFVDSGVASVVADHSAGRSVEIGMIGREGVTGLGAIMGSGRAPYDTFMQVPGTGRRVPSDTMRSAMDASVTLRRAVLAYAYAFNVQVGMTALSNARSRIEDRLARWLLMVHDRIDGDQVKLTHEFLATMLGVRRAGVTIALGHLEKQGLIEMQRGAIIIADREGLEHSSNGAYGAAEQELRHNVEP